MSLLIKKGIIYLASYDFLEIYLEQYDLDIKESDTISSSGCYGIWRVLDLTNQFSSMYPSINSR